RTHSGDKKRRCLNRVSSRQSVLCYRLFGDTPTTTKSLTFQKADNHAGSGEGVYSQNRAHTQGVRQQVNRTKFDQTNNITNCFY
ncbi:MAG: hypothetical protein WD601_05770, partial [Pseudohongiellaceae bacterium]